jgi:hypothetical protein
MTKIAARMASLFRKTLPVQKSKYLRTLIFLLSVHIFFKIKHVKIIDEKEIELLSTLGVQQCLKKLPAWNLQTLKICFAFRRIYNRVMKEIFQTKNILESLNDKITNCSYSIVLCKESKKARSSGTEFSFSRRINNSWRESHS